MTDQNIIEEFISTPGMILQHCNKREYLKNELGATVIYATDHREEKSVKSISFEEAKDIMRLNKYVLPYNCNVDDIIKAIADEIKDGDEQNCDYIADDDLLKNLTA